jgi:peptidoglycan/LPS O-acetylase OafA/YrhL
LRAIAVSLVVYAHSIDLVEYFKMGSFQASYKYLQNFGAIGVDIFFIISGFIMVFVTSNVDSFSKITSFFKKRMIRLYALYIPITLFFIFYKKPDVLTILKNFLLLPIFDSGTQFIMPSINIAWTLSFELFFYTLFTIALIINRKKHSVIVMLILLLFVLGGLFFKSNEVHFVFFTNPIFLEFVFGILLGIIYLKKIIIPNVIALLMFISAIVCFGLLIYNGYDAISEANFTIDGTASLWRVYLWGMPSFLLVGSILYLFHNSTNASNSIHSERKTGASIVKKIMMLIGDASYSIYLTHTLIFSAFIYFQSFFTGIPNGDLLIILFFIAAIIIGCLTYVFIENPLLGFVKKKLL